MTVLEEKWFASWRNELESNVCSFVRDSSCRYDSHGRLKTFQTKLDQSAQGPASTGNTHSYDIKGDQAWLAVGLGWTETSEGEPDLCAPPPFGWALPVGLPLGAGWSEAPEGERD